MDTGSGIPGRSGPDPLTAIRAVCITAARSLGMQGASVSVALPVGHRGRVTATDEIAAWLDEIQFSLGEGPSVRAYQQGHPVVVGDAACEDAGRWPAFLDAMREKRIGVIVALPLQIGVIRLGTMTLYGTDAVDVSGDDLAGALRFADLATSCVLDLVGTADQPGAAEPVGEIAREFDADLYRVEVHQASGMVSMQLAIPIEQALARIRAHAYADGTPLVEVARAIIAGTLRLET